MRLHEKYKFQRLYSVLIERLRSFGLSDSQIMGADHHIESVYRADTLGVGYSTLDWLETAKRDDVMRERHFFQRKFQQYGLLPLTEEGIKAVEREKAEVEAQEQLRRLREVEARTAQQIRDEKKKEREEKQVIRKKNLKAIQELPDNFTIEDL